MARNLVRVFIIALVLNFVWEEAHSVLYVSYQGAEITHALLLRAALFDAAVITFFVWFFLRFSFFRERRWLFVLFLFIFAVLLEQFALATGRWVYAPAMPIIPFFKVGLTPAIQLALLGFLSLLIAEGKRR